MSMDKYRKCAKCGKSRADDMTVSFHRFPNPGFTNMTKASAWAKYCFPTEEWTSLDFLKSLYRKNKVLCGRHFHSSKFYDNMRQKLSKFAVPDSDEVQELLSNKENLFTQHEQQAIAGPSQSQTLSSIENVPQQPQYYDHDYVGSTYKEPHTQHEQQAIAGPSQSQTLSSIENVPQQPQYYDHDYVGSTYKEPHTQNVHQQIAGPSQTFTSIENLPQFKVPGFAELTPGGNIFNRSAILEQKSSSVKRKGILKELSINKKSELSPKELKLYNICKRKMKEVSRLRKELKKKKQINTLEKLVEDDNIKKLCHLNLTNSFITLLQSQIQNCPKKPKGRRYSIEQKILALVIYKKSPGCYRLLRRMFALPGQSCLNKLLNSIPLKPGINRHIFDTLKKMSENQTKEENLCLLLFDEMSIRKHLQYDVKQDMILGFEDHGNHGRNSEVTTKALVFMLAGIRKKWKQPIAFYFSHTLSADRMTVILKEILRECMMSNIEVVGTVCDMSSVNMKVLKTLGVSTREPYFEYLNREYVTILDPPHLLKCTRNMLMKHDVECTSDLQSNDISSKGIVKWSHIEAFYNLDSKNQNFVYAPALTDQHIHPNVKQQMRVKLAAQVFSHSVAAGIFTKIALRELPAEAHATASFVKKMDNLFDALNTDSPEPVRGKIYTMNITASSPHLELFGQMRKFISAMKYVGAKNKPPSQDGWIHTMNAVERLWKNFTNRNIKSISTRRLNQDALENCFGCIRYNCGSNYNPTIQQFVAGIKTAIITNLRHTGQKKNCEDDSAVLDNNLKTFLIGNEQQVMEDCNKNLNLDFEALLTDAVEAVEEATSESQACAYVSGFIFKKLKNNKCQQCRDAFVTNSPEAIHIFTSMREYDENVIRLNYINREAVLCIEACATIINNFLKVSAHILNLKDNVFDALKVVNFDFLHKCATHYNENIEHVKKSTFFICIKRYTILRNRDMGEDEKNKALQRKIKIVKNK